MLLYNCSVFTNSTVTSRKCEINIIVIVRKGFLKHMSFESEVKDRGKM